MLPVSTEDHIHNREDGYIRLLFDSEQIVFLEAIKLCFRTGTTDMIKCCDKKSAGATSGIKNNVLRADANSLDCEASDMAATLS